MNSLSPNFKNDVKIPQKFYVSSFPLATAPPIWTKCGMETLLFVLFPNPVAAKRYLIQFRFAGHVLVFLPQLPMLPRLILRFAVSACNGPTDLDKIWHGNSTVCPLSESGCEQAISDPVQICWARFVFFPSIAYATACDFTFCRFRWQRPHRFGQNLA
jgi:hypothetical protein